MRWDGLTLVLCGALCSTEALSASPPAKPRPLIQTAPAVSASDTLWGKSRVGMSLATVQSLYLEAQLDGGTLMLRQVLLGRPAAVMFEFQNDRLAKVTMLVQAGSAEVQSEMTKSYGAPSGCGAISSSTYICRWRQGTLHIDASTVGNQGTLVEYTRGTADTATF